MNYTPTPEHIEAAVALPGARLGAVREARERVTMLFRDAVGVRARAEQVGE